MKQDNVIRKSLPSKKYLQFQDREWHDLRAILGNSWAMYIYLLGGRGIGKSYCTMRFFVAQYKKYGRPFYWLRLTDIEREQLLKNNAADFIDPDTRRDYNLDLVSIGDVVYDVKRDAKGKVIKKIFFARVMALSNYHVDKGKAIYDADFLKDPKMYYNICLDEFQREKTMRKTFDVAEAFGNQLENICRKEKERVRIICIGNTLETAADILTTINFIPEEFGRYKLKNKRAVVDFIPLTAVQAKKNEGTAASAFIGNNSTYTNSMKFDTSYIYRGKMIKPDTILKFSQNKNDWFTVWDGNIIAPYNGEKVKKVIYMRPYVNMIFDVKTRDSYIIRFQTGLLMFKNLLTQKKFTKQLELLKPSGK